MTDQLAKSLIVESEAKPVILLEIRHGSLTDSIRVVNDNADLTHNGNIYTAVSFGITLPTQRQNQFTKASVWVDRYSDIIVDWIERSNGARGAQFILKQVLRDTPDIIEMQLNLVAKSIRYSTTQIHAELGFNYDFNKPFCAWKFTPLSAPGLFA